MADARTFTVTVTCEVFGNVRNIAVTLCDMFYEATNEKLVCLLKHISKFVEGFFVGMSKAITS